MFVFNSPFLTTLTRHQIIVIVLNVVSLHPWKLVEWVMNSPRIHHPLLHEYSTRWDFQMAFQKLSQKLLMRKLLYRDIYIRVLTKILMTLNCRITRNLNKHQVVNNYFYASYLFRMTFSRMQLFFILNYYLILMDAMGIWVSLCRRQCYYAVILFNKIYLPQNKLYCEPYHDNDFHYEKVSKSLLLIFRNRWEDT